MVTGPARASSPVSGATSAVRPFASPGPNAPVGPTTTGDRGAFDGPPGDSRSNKVVQTGSLRIPMRRRRLRGIVFGTLAMCTLILVAAVVSRVGHASNEAAAVPPFPTTMLAPVTPSATPQVPSPTATAQPSPPAAAGATTGTLRIERPAVPSRVWLDGKKLAGSSLLTTCGTHQIKIGWRSHARSIQVPCGGELVVSR